MQGLIKSSDFLPLDKIWALASYDGMNSSKTNKGHITSLKRRQYDQLEWELPSFIAFQSNYFLNVETHLISIGTPCLSYLSL